MSRCVAMQATFDSGIAVAFHERMCSRNSDGDCPPTSSLRDCFFAARTAG